MRGTLRYRVLVGGLVMAAAIWLPVRAADEAIDYASLAKIRAEGLTADRSKVMEIASWLTDVHGPRLTGSPTLEEAARWTVEQMTAWGLEGAALEPWPSSTDPAHPSNSFPRGWVNEKFYVASVGSQAFPISGTPVAWTPGTDGLVRGEVVLVTETTREALAKYQGTLRGKWILGSDAPDVAAYWTPPARRYTREELDRMETPAPPAELGLAPPGRGGRGDGAAPAAPGRGGAPAGRGGTPPAPFSRNEFFKSEGALGVLTTAARGHGIYTIGGASRTADLATLLPVIAIPAEPFGRMARLLAKKLPVTIEADIKNTFVDQPAMFNVVGELRGRDKAEEVVMLGAHFDSWHASTGATDNAAGSAVMLEAMRILKQSGVPLRRTVRIGLWTGEEQGIFGSALYVREHFGGGRGGRGMPAVPPTPAHARFSAYFNLDNGTGAIRGVHLQQNSAAAPIFRQWIEPLRDLGVTHLRDRNTGGTDHVSFDAAGLPGWQFIQDPVEYDSMTHHTNLDSYERLQPEDMRRNATIVAAFAFFAANREELMPRK